MSEKQENLFKPVGEAAEEVSQEQTLPNGVKLTGAQDAMGHPVQEIESLCMNCHKNGTTRMLLTSIPYFREVVIMSFECPHCGFKNSEIQPASSIQEKGSKYSLKVENKDDFNRQVIKSETASCKFVELDIEIPPKRGVLTTVEGLLEEMIEDLQSDQEMRKKIDEAMYDKIDLFIKKVRATIDCTPEGTLPVTFELDDPSGNSWIEYKPGEPQHKWSHIEYLRTDEQNVQIGIMTQDQYEERRKEKLAAVADHERNPSEATKVESNFLSDETDIENYANEVQTFRATCPSCMKECETHMKPVNIPHFKEVIIMSTTCEHCGYKSNEVKTGGAIPEKGRKITLLCDDPSDLSRDILKSESCSLVVPELSLDIQEGTLGGRFTTVEGLLRQVYEELESRVFSQTSDSMDQETKDRWIAFFAKLKEALAGKVKFTMIMTDPLAGSYIQNVYAPDPDPNMTIEDYERTAQQNEDLGLSEMKV
ncbi:nucleolar zinc-finger protein [Maudiozyma exigua]|uniref:Nucleolar zinc-finger protein n=1 Tax=Maudiozyma exigua TaxID=34358 RepID=A0A9P6WDU6_MAUEX|nr:nucleolar zinc-finger protein [Kazachstania exigua]